MAKKKTSTTKSEAKSKAASVKKDVEDQVQNIADAAEDVQAEAETVIEATAEEVTSESSGDNHTASVVEPSQEDSTTGADEGVLSEDSDTPPLDDVDVSASEAELTGDGSQAHANVVPVATQTVVERKGGFFPMLLGGLLAGGIGFGASYYWFQQSGGSGISDFQNEVTAKFEQNSADISGLADSIANLPEPPDTESLIAGQSDLAASLDSLVDRLNATEETLASMDARLTTVEKRPISEGASDAAVAAYERELKALQDTMAAQRAEIEAMAQEARSMENSAEDTAKSTMLRAALSRIQTALDSGTGFAPALGDLQDGGVAIPAALSDVAEDGVPSLGQLQSSFPDAARAALAVSRQHSADSGEQSGFSAFLKNQLGTRSLEPREGSDPDAVLSRAEAAVRDGRLADTLAEIEALPEVGRDALSEWTANVTRRQAAVSAVEALGQELN